LLSIYCKQSSYPEKRYRKTAIVNFHCWKLYPNEAFQVLIY
jgi:hypothetical protein